MKTDSWPYSTNRQLIFGMLTFALLFTTVQTDWAESPLDSTSFPVMAKLQRGDSLFDQFSADLSGYYKARARHQAIPSLTLMHYTIGKGETLFMVSARLNLPHSTLASLNRLSNPGKFREGMVIIVPNLPGIYLPAVPKSGIEQMLALRLQDKSELATTIRFETGSNVEEFLYFPSEDFSPQERRAFLGSLFTAPLPSYHISSPFGPRKNPFSGQLIHHDGLDLVAPIGTIVSAANEGLVLEEGYDPVYGNFIIIDHGDGYETVYGHLKKFLVRKSQQVSSGTAIGQVGMSGQTTGPHLHFEIHFNGVPRDPAPFLHRRR